VDGLIGLDKPVSNPKAIFFEVPGPSSPCGFSTPAPATPTGQRATRPAPARRQHGRPAPGRPLHGRPQTARGHLGGASPLPTHLRSVLQPVSALVFDLKTHMFGREDDTVPGRSRGSQTASRRTSRLARRRGTSRRVPAPARDVPPGRGALG
jgi:hypothetical protein